MYGVFDKHEYKAQLRANIFLIPKLFFRDLKYCIQRIRKGYCDKDWWSIDAWFLSVMPDMLSTLKKERHGSPASLGENYTDENGILCNDACHKEWDKTLDKMIFLLHEADEESCSEKNIYESTYDEILSKEFLRYSFCDSEKKHRNNEQEYTKINYPKRDLNYDEISEKYLAEKKKLDKYRNNCKNEALEMFSKWFWDLWD